MKVEAKQIPIEQKIFTENWIFLKKYYYIENDTKFNSFLQEAKKISKLATETAAEQLAYDITRSVVNYIDKINKEHGDG